MHAVHVCMCVLCMYTFKSTDKIMTLSRPGSSDPGSLSRGIVTIDILRQLFVVCLDSDFSCSVFGVVVVYSLSNLKAFWAFLIILELKKV